ncbi:MAG: hypothetical protein J4O13_04335, partial [Chloroflexi bacterium]|nr:hypothetical protein [Chloroflexota bacterium]
LLGKIGRGILMAAAGFYASDFLIDLFDTLELQFVSDLLDSWLWRAIIGIVALISIAVLVVALREARKRNLI